MPANVPTVEDLQTLKKELLEEIAKLFANRNPVPPKKWLKSNELRKILPLSVGTLQNLRVNGTLPFTKIGGVIFYNYDDIEKIIQRNKQNMNDSIL